MCNVPSAPIFALRADDFSLNLRARMQLPTLLAPFHSLPVHRLLSQTGIATQVHNALRDSILSSAALADHAVKQEPVGIYGLGQRTGVDGIIERDPPTGPVLPRAAGIIISSTRGRAAFDVFTTGNPSPAWVRARASEKNRRYGAAVRAAGDLFFAPAFSSSGAPLESAIKFFEHIAHTGDSIPASEGRDAPRFDAEMSTWATPTHVAFMVHAAAAAAARAIARAVREYAKRRLIDHYLVEVADNTVVIPRPDISAFTA